VTSRPGLAEYRTVAAVQGRLKHKGTALRERVLISKVANALVPTEELQGGGHNAQQSASELVLERFAAHYGGLWVGGRVVLADASLSFAPNAMNRAVQKGVEEISVDLRDIDSVEVLPGFFTKIIAMKTGAGVLKIRCYGARAFAEEIRAAVAARRRE
jgi:hypothetical protein